MPLHIAYRPSAIDEVIGNDAIKASLKSLFSRKDHPHVFLFTGPSGTGKTTFGRIIAKMVGCEPEDFKEYNAANTRGIDTIREITENAHYSALVGKVKVYLLDEFHMVTGAAANAILKILEDCPNHVYFVLCTTEPEKLLPTIKNRCTTYQTSLLTEAQLKKLLLFVLKKEGIGDFSEVVLKEIIKSAEGCPRQALVMLDAVVDIEDEKEAIATISVANTGESEVIDICRAIVKGVRWRDIKTKVKEVLLKTEPEKLRLAILGYCTAVMLNRDDNDLLSEIIDLFSENTYSSGKAGIVNAIYLACKLTGGK
jgi:DNA polymerase-3 subunit gamma/tau